jgi:hypothetical protein
MPPSPRTREEIQDYYKKFIRVWQESVSVAEVASKMAGPLSRVASEAERLRKHGVKLKKMMGGAAIFQAREGDWAELRTLSEELLPPGAALPEPRLPRAKNGKPKAQDEDRRCASCKKMNRKYCQQCKAQVVSLEASA